MKSILSLSAFLILFSVKGISQESINAYKYIVIPEAYNFLNEPDQYQINSLTKFLFDKLGFTALMTGEEFPEELNANRCKALYADVEKHKAFLNTKLQVHLKDCNNKIVVSSEVGSSREKEYSKVYNLALRDAFKSFENLNYAYEPSSSTISTPENKNAVTKTENAQAEIDRLKMEVEALRDKQQRVTREENKTSVVKNIEVPKESAVKTSNKEADVVKKEAKAELAETLKKDSKAENNFQNLYANPVENGYTITDASSKILYHLVFSGKEDVYIVKGQDAVVYKMNNTWIVSSATDSGVTMRTLNVKFDQ